MLSMPASVRAAHCLEVGAGGGSIAHWLCQAVGPTGRVLATDIDPGLVAIDAPPGSKSCNTT